MIVNNNPSQADLSSLLISNAKQKHKKPSSKMGQALQNTYKWSVFFLKNSVEALAEALLIAPIARDILLTKEYIIANKDRHFDFVVKNTAAAIETVGGGIEKVSDATLTTMHTLGVPQKVLGSAEKGLDSQIARLHRNYGNEAINVILELSNFVTNMAMEKCPYVKEINGPLPNLFTILDTLEVDKNFLKNLTEIIIPKLIAAFGAENTADTIKANVINLICNLLEKSTLNSKKSLAKLSNKELIDAQKKRPHFKFDFKKNEIGLHLHDAIQNIVLPIVDRINNRMTNLERECFVAEINLKIAENNVTLITERQTGAGSDRFKEFCIACNIVEERKAKIVEIMKEMTGLEQEKKQLLAEALLQALFPEKAKSVIVLQNNLIVYPVQNFVWHLIKNNLPAQLIKILPFVDLTTQKTEMLVLENHPYGALWKEGLDYLLNDLTRLILNKLDIPTTLHKEIEDVVYPLLRHLGVVLINNLNSISSENWLKINELIANLHTTKLEDASQTAQLFATQLLTLLNLNDLEKLLKLPAFATTPLQQLLNKFLVEKITDYLVKPEFNLSQIKVTECKEGKIAHTAVKVSTLEKALPAIINHVINEKFDLSIKEVNGQPKIVNLIAKHLGEKTNELANGTTWSILSFLNEKVNQGKFNPLLKIVIESLLTQAQVKDSKDKMRMASMKDKTIKLVDPLLVNMGIQLLTPILEKEKKGGALFDQTLLLQLLPILNNYLKALNNKSLMPSSLSLGELQQTTATQLIKLFLPQQEQTLRQLFPVLNEEQIHSIWQLLTSKLPTVMPLLKDLIFDQSLLQDILIEIYQSCIKVFDAPISTSTSVNRVLSANEINLQKKLEPQMSQLIYQAAKLTDLPVDKFLKFLKFLPGNRHILRIINRAICTAIQKKFNGALIAESIENGLISQINKKPKVIDKALMINRLEEKLVKSLFSFSLRSVKRKIDFCLNTFNLPVIKHIKNCLVALSIWFLNRIVGTLIRVFKIEAKLRGKLTNRLRKNRMNFEKAYAQPLKHEKLVFQSANQVLTWLNLI